MLQAAPSAKTLLCAAAFLGAALATGRAARADHINVEPGNWEVSISTEMPGMPAMPAHSVTHCIKEQDRDSQSFAEAMQKRGDKNRKCQVSDLKVDNDKLSYSFACEGGHSGTAEYAFHGTTYEGTTKMTMQRGGGQPMTMTQHIKAKRIGDC